jgi:hypothetical protein
MRVSSASSGIGVVVDGGPLRECQYRPLRNEGIVLGEAMNTAKQEIDRAFGPGGGVGCGGVGGGQ